MGIFDNMLGSNSAGHIKGRAKMELAIDNLANPGMLSDLIEEIRRGHEQAVSRIVYVLGNALRHHAGLSQAEGRAYLENPFLQRFVEVHSLEFYKLGCSLGSQIKAGQADERYQQEIGILCKDQGDAAMAEARKTIRNEKVVECFIIAGREAFERGVSDSVAS